MVTARIGAAMLMAGFFGSAHAANLIKDGGFETPAPPAGGYKIYQPGGKIGPWSVIGSSGNVSTVSGSLVVGGVTLAAQSGKALADLSGDCDCGANSGVAQTVSTIIGKTYKLTFWAGNAAVAGHGLTGIMDVYVGFPSGSYKLMTAQSFGGQGATTQTWQQFTATFVATDTKTTISFVNAEPAGYYQCDLDSVSLVQQ